MRIEENQVIVRNQKGEEIKCDVLLTYEDEKTKKNFICYTDYTSDASGRMAVYVSVYDPDSKDRELKQVESEEDMKIIEEILNELKEELEEDDEEDEEEDDEDDEEDAEDDDDEDDEEDIEDEEDSEDMLSNLKEMLNNASMFVEFARKAYMGKSYAAAEKAYLKALELEDTIPIRNGLAHLIRRGEVEDAKKYSEKDVIALLREGVKKKDIFSTINMALFWALRIGGGEDWNLADQLIGNLADGKYTEADMWWEGIAKNGDAEGYLVHLLLLRHRKIKESRLGSMNFLYEMVKKEYGNIPEYMKTMV